MSPRDVLRRQCREARAALPDSHRRLASAAICSMLGTSALFHAASRIALYWPVGPEVDLRDTIEPAQARGKRCYLPVMQPDRQLLFARYRAQAGLRRNSHGIPEPGPQETDRLTPPLLDLVCVPLLGFDRHGNRLGQGGGYYDRSFAFLRVEPAPRPVLVGVAFACQELAAVAAEAWDVPLAWIITENGLIDCGAASAQE